GRPGDAARLGTRDAASKSAGRRDPDRRESPSGDRTGLATRAVARPRADRTQPLGRSQDGSAWRAEAQPGAGGGALSDGAGLPARIRLAASGRVVPPRLRIHTSRTAGSSQVTVIAS